MTVTTPEQNTVYLIDGSAYIYRAYHAIRSLSTAAGLPTNAVFGYVTMLRRVLREKQPRYLAIAFDAKGPTFRHQIYDAYKANRPSMPDDLVVQLPYIKRLSAAHNLCCLEQPGFEADDILASLCRHLTAQGQQVVVVSGDKDLLQLVSDSVMVWDPMQDRWFDRQAVAARYGVPVENLLDYFALVGDSSDNIPGVKGVGPKSAAKLIDQYASLEEVYAHLAEAVKGKMLEKLAAGRKAAFLSRKLIRLADQVPVPEPLSTYEVSEPDNEKLYMLYQELEFSSLAGEIAPPPPAMDSSGFTVVQTEEELAALCATVGEADVVALDCETDSLDPLVARLVGLSICVGPEKAWYLPLGHRDADGALVSGQLELQLVLDRFRPVLENPTLPKLGHNLKFDYAVLYGQGIRLAGPLWDTMIASYLLDPSRRSHKLDLLCEEILQLRLTSFAQVTANDKRPEAFSYVDLVAAGNYSCEDVAATVLLWNHFRGALEQEGLWELFSGVEIPLIPILAAMERHGVLVDPVELQEISADFSTRLADLEEEIHALAGESFNINSPRQLGEILFGKLGLPHGRKTKTGYSTDVKVLEKLAGRHELPARVMDHRMLTKLKNTYVDKLQELIHPRTGRVHTSFNQTVTATGRLSSSNPNLQNIPIRTAEGQRIRRAFVAAPEQLLVAADYSQIDLRVLAHYSGDPALVETFRTGGDVHRQTAAEIFWVNPELVTKAMRRVAKTINFGIVYGMSPYGLASQLQISRKEAATFIDRYFGHYPGVKTYMEEIVAKAKEEGCVTTLLHRQRRLPEITSSNKMRREFAERTAINTPIQGTAADIIKLATIAVDDYLQRQQLNAKLILQIHDELVLEVPKQEVETVAGGIKEVMESVLTLSVPLVVNVTTGKTLADL